MRLAAAQFKRGVAMQRRLLKVMRILLLGHNLRIDVEEPLVGRHELAIDELYARAERGAPGAAATLDSPRPNLARASPKTDDGAPSVGPLRLPASRSGTTGHALLTPQGSAAARGKRHCAGDRRASAYRAQRSSGRPSGDDCVRGNAIVGARSGPVRGYVAQGSGEGSGEADDVCTADH